MAMTTEMTAEMMKNMSARDLEMMGFRRDPIPKPEDGDSIVSPGDSGAPGK